MGKKSRRRPDKKEGRPNKSAPPPARGSGYSQVDVMNQTQLMKTNYCGVGNEWTYWDDALLGDAEFGMYDEAYVEDEERELAEVFANLDLKNYEKGSKDALRAALDKVWSNKKLSNPHGVGLAMGGGSRSEWTEWALDMAILPDNVASFFIEYEKDKDVHRSTLDRLGGETENGFRGSLDYILALNCILQDTFQRTGLEPPPPLNLHQALLIKRERGRPLYEVRMQVWNGYQKLVLKMVKTVNEHPLVPKPAGHDHSKMSPLKKSRGEFPPSLKRWEEENEGEGMFGGACGFSGAEVEELMAQGVKPWDDDAHDVLAALEGGHDY